MLNRTVSAIRLDRTLYREVADNESYMNESITIAVVVALVSSLGVLFSSSRPILAYIFQVINSLLFGWVLWSVVAYYVGSQFFGGRSSVSEMMRTLAYANTPRLLSLLSFIPCLGPILSLVGWLLSIGAGVIAIRESMEFDTEKAVITAVIGFLLFLVVSLVIGFLWAGVTLPFQLLGR